jgi:hypothetical protein
MLLSPPNLRKAYSRTLSSSLHTLLFHASSWYPQYLGNKCHGPDLTYGLWYHRKSIQFREKKHGFWKAILLLVDLNPVTCFFFKKWEYLPHRITGTKEMQIYLEFSKY